mgnify:CR=1 FL=1
MVYEHVFSNIDEENDVKDYCERNYRRIQEYKELEHTIVSFPRLNLIDYEFLFQTYYIMISFYILTVIFFFLELDNDYFSLAFLQKFSVSRKL